MAEYLLRNSLNPWKVVKCLVTFRQIVNKGEDGEQVWLVEIKTNEPHKDGGIIPPAYIHYTSESNLDLEIKKATELIAQQVDWQPVVVDLRPPFVSKSIPENNSIVSIYSDVYIDITDVLPAAGIDSDSIRITINDIDDTGRAELTGDPYGYSIRWYPPLRILDYE